MTKEVQAVVAKLDRRVETNEQIIVDMVVMAESVQGTEAKIKLMSDAKALLYANNELQYIKDWISRKLPQYVGKL